MVRSSNAPLDNTIGLSGWRGSVMDIGMRVICAAAKKMLPRFVQAAVPDPAGLPVVHAGVVPERSHRVDSIALDLAGSPYAAALAASLHTEVFLERVVPG